MYLKLGICFALVLGLVLPVWPYSRGWGFQPALVVALIFGALSMLKVFNLI